MNVRSSARMDFLNSSRSRLRSMAAPHAKWCLYRMDLQVPISIDTVEETTAWA
jgi:hypothetical protein